VLALGLGGFPLEDAVEAGLAHDVGGLDARPAPGRRREVCEAQLLVLLPVPVGGHLGEAAEALLARLQLLFRLAAGRDVDHEQDDDARTVRCGQAGLLHHHPGGPAGDAVRVFVVDVGVVRERPVVGVDEEGGVFLVEEVVVGPAEDQVRAALEELLERAIGGDVVVPGVLHEDRARDRVDERLQELGRLADLVLGAVFDRDVGDTPR
jgi:hypothetical protein